MVLFRLIASDMSTLYMYSGKFCLSLLLRIFLHTVYSGKVPCRLIASNISISIQGKLCLGLLPVIFVLPVIFRLAYLFLPCFVSLAICEVLPGVGGDTAGIF